MLLRRRYVCYMEDGVCNLKNYVVQLVAYGGVIRV